MPTITLNVPLLKSLLVLASIIEARDPCTGGHTWRVSQYARRLAEKAGFPEDEVFITYLGGLVHDIGKVGVPDAILRKDGALNDVEYAVIKKHPQVGRDLIRDHPLAAIVTDVVAEHHERYDGRGYPYGLEGGNISPLSRVVAVADAFDAMTSARPYRPGMPAAKAIEIIAAESGTQFDPFLARVFTDLWKQGDLNHVLGHSAEGRPMLTCPTCGPIVRAPLGAGDGAQVVCPLCTGIYLLHTKAGTFEIEWLGTTDPTHMPQPDMDTVEDFIRRAPRAIAEPVPA